MLFCIKCSEERPLDVYVNGQCQECSGHDPPAVECEERVTIRGKGVTITARDVQAYHLYGRPERDRSPAEQEWLRRYAAEQTAIAPVTSETLPEYIEGTWCGEKGSRCDLTVTVERVTELEPGDYGKRFLVHMVEASGATVVWFTGENLNLYDGVTYKVRATVKAHEVYRGRRQTVVQRLTVVEEVRGEAF